MDFRKNKHTGLPTWEDLNPDDKIFNDYQNEIDDFKKYQPYKYIKNEYDVYTDFVRPTTKSGQQVTKSIDPSDGNLKTGFGFSGFDETINSDLTTSIISSSEELAYIHLADCLLAELEQFQVIHRVNVKPSHRLLLHKRAMFMSILKSKKGRLLEILTTQKSESVVRRQDIQENKSAFAKSDSYDSNKDFYN